MKVIKNLSAVTPNVAHIDSRSTAFAGATGETLPIVFDGDEKRVTKLFNSLLSKAFQYADNNPMAWNVRCERLKNGRLKNGHMLISDNNSVIFFQANGGRENGQKDSCSDGASVHKLKLLPSSILNKPAESLIQRKKQRNRNHGKFQRMVMHGVILNVVTDLVEQRGGMAKNATNTQRCLEILCDEIHKDGIYREEFKNFNLEHLLSSARLHDIGKIGISDSIIHKPGKLTDEEYEVMKTHVGIGVEAIRKFQRNMGEYNIFLDCAEKVVATHHEKWDGTGYPLGLRENEIPLEGRLMAIVDVYDALVSRRPYKTQLNPEAAFKVIKFGSGKHFDPQLVEAFAKAEDKLIRC